MSELGRTMVYIGLGIAFFGGILFVMGRLFPSLGNLPGDIRIQGENGRVFIPITTMILVSIVATIVLNLLIRYFRR